MSICFTSFKTFQWNEVYHFWGKLISMIQADMQSNCCLKYHSRKCFPRKQNFNAKFKIKDGWLMGLIVTVKRKNEINNKSWFSFIFQMPMKFDLQERHESSHFQCFFSSLLLRFKATQIASLWCVQNCYLNYNFQIQTHMLFSTCVRRPSKFDILFGEGFVYLSLHSIGIGQIHF